LTGPARNGTLKEIFLKLYTVLGFAQSLKLDVLRTSKLDTHLNITGKVRKLVTGGAKLS
jgi:hypothetical protein